jgi:hypothetical protein
MNLWASRIGQLTTLAVALFFFSCEDETSTLGYKNPNSKFKVSYVEIPIESSVLLRDSLRTSNFLYSGEPNRLMVGSYFDEVFGQIEASSVSQYFATNPQFKVSSTAVYDSVTLQLQFDLYHYGSMAPTPQTISIYEINEELKYDTLKYYFNNTQVDYSTILGSKSFSIDPAKFDDFAESAEDSDTVISISIPLDAAFGKRIFDSNVKFRDATGEADSTYMRYSEFVKEFKGIAIKSDVADKIVGFNPTGGSSRILIHYHDATADSLMFAMNFSGVVGFNQVKSNRSGTEIESVKEYYTDALLESDKRYIQSGVGILTKLDFSKFYEFTDTVPYSMINSAELSIEGVESSPNYPPPSLLSLRILDENTNRMKRFNIKNSQDAADVRAYNQLLGIDVGFQSAPAVVDSDSVMYALDRTLNMGYSSTENRYSMVLSLFLQQLAAPLEEKTRFKTFVLHPAAQTSNVPQAQSGLKTVNRVVFPKDKIKLKVFYTKPSASR